MKKAVKSGFFVGAFLCASLIYSAPASATHICHSIWIPPIPWLYIWCPEHPPYP